MGIHDGRIGCGWIERWGVRVIVEFEGGILEEMNECTIKEKKWGCRYSLTSILRVGYARSRAIISMSNISEVPYN